MLTGSNCHMTMLRVRLAQGRVRTRVSMSVRRRPLPLDYDDSSIKTARTKRESASAFCPFAPIESKFQRWLY